MGSVWVADHLALRTQVVVKFMLNELASSPTSVARFSREAAAAANVKSPHVVQILDHGITEEKVPYIVMELLEGQDLAHRLEAPTPLSLGEVARILGQTCKALARAHERGIVHRDIKPENIFLCNMGDGEVFVKLLDFGVAKANGGEGLSATKTGAMVGTPYYMSPEQAIGLKTVDHRTDLWSLGVVAFQALTGKRPFEADNIGALVVAIHSGPIPVPSSLNPGLPPTVDAWFSRACARDAAARFSSAKEMAEQFEAALAGARVASGRSSSPAPGLLPLPGSSGPAVPGGLSTTGAGAASVPTVAKSRTPRLVVVGAGGALLALGAGIAVHQLSGRGAASVSTSPPPQALGASASASVSASSEAPGTNRWVRVEPPSSPVTLGVPDTAPKEARGLRYARHVLAPKTPYDIQQHEVTWGELTPWLDANPASRADVVEPADLPAEHRLLPVTGIGWDAARDYCRSIGGTLPREDEWEYAARGPELRRFPWGDEPLDRGRTNAYASKAARLAPVMTNDQDQTTSLWSLPVFDLAGNAREWTADLYKEDRPARSPADEAWVQEGGMSWRTVRGLPIDESPPADLRAPSIAHRSEVCGSGPCPKGTDARRRFVGFRCVRHQG